MAAPVNYYWGDVLTTGNTTMQQSLTVLGQPYFVANIQSVTDGTAIIGVASTPFSNIYATQSNVGTANLTSPLSILTPVPLSGNLLASNALQTTNVTGTTMNAAQVVTVGAALTSVGTGGANFNLSGNVYTGSMKTTNVSVATGNVALMNTVALVTATVGATGATFGISGNLYVSNALSTTNISATRANVSGGANVTSVTAGQVFVNGPGTSTFSAIGNAYVSNAITTSNISGAAPASVATANIGGVLNNLNATQIPMSNAWAYVPFSGNSAETLTGNLTNPTFNSPYGSPSYPTRGGPGDGPYVNLNLSNLAYTVNQGLNLTNTIAPNPVTEPFVVSFWFKLLVNPAGITTQSTLLSLVSDIGEQFNIVITSTGRFAFEYYTIIEGWQGPWYPTTVIQNNKCHFITLLWTPATGPFGATSTFIAQFDSASGGYPFPSIQGPSRINRIVIGSRVDGTQQLLLPAGISGLRIFKSLNSNFFDVNYSNQLPLLDARNWYENRILGNVAASNSIMISDSVIATVMQGSTMNTSSLNRLSISLPRPWILINFDQNAQDTGSGGVVGPVYTYNGILPGLGSWRKNGPGGAPSMYLDGVTYGTVYLNWTLSRYARFMAIPTPGDIGEPWWGDFTGLTVSIWVKFGASTPPAEFHAPALFSLCFKSNSDSYGDTQLGVSIGDPFNYSDGPKFGLIIGNSVTSASSARAVPDKWHHVVIMFTNSNSDIKFYINGSYEGSTGYNPYTGGSYYVSESMHIGRTPDNNSIWDASGLSYIECSRLAFFDRELKLDEVRALYQLNAAPIENQVCGAVSASNAVTVPSLLAYGSLGATTMNVDSLPTVSFNMKLDPIINFDFDGRLTSSVPNPFIGTANSSGYTYKRTGGPGGGPSIYLQGSGDPSSVAPGFVTWPTSVIPLTATGFSISIWFKLTPNTQNYSPYPDNRLLSWAAGWPAGSPNFFINFESYSGAIYMPNSIGYFVYSDPLAWNRGEWNHVTVTYVAGVGYVELIIYVNGSIALDHYPPPLPVPNLGGSPLTIGGCQDNIELADFKIFQRPLSAAEVTKLYRMKGLGNQTTIFGNLSASNALTATNVFAQNASLTTLNTSSVSSTSVRPPTISPKWWIPMSYSLAEVNGRLSIDTTTYVSGATFTEGSPIGGGVAVFTTAGNSQGYLTSSQNTGLYFDNGITISCWVKYLDSPSGSLFNMNSGPVNFNVDVDFNGFYFGYDGLAVRFYALSNDVNYNPPVTSNTWYHVVAQLGSYTGGDVYQTIWVNGVETTQTLIRAINYPGIYAWDVLVGSGYSMQMFDVRVYSSSISQTEIKALYEWKASPHTAAIRGNISVSNSLSTTKVTGLGVSNVAGSLNVNSITTKWPINQIGGLIGQIDFAGSYNDVFGKLTYSSGSGTFSQNGPIGGPSATFSSTLFLTMPYYYAECWSGSSISLWFNSALYDFFSMNASYFYPGIRFFILPGSPDTLFIYMFYDPNLGQNIIPTLSMTMPDNGWHHICLNINPSLPGGADPSASLYFDGNFVQTTTGTGFSGALVNQFFQETMFFGNGNFTGFKLFSKTLSVAEIAALASPGVANPSELMVYGNISVANSFSSNILLTSNMNATTLNTASWSINTFSLTNIAVQNTFTVAANVETLNAASVTTGTLVSAGFTGLSNLTTGNAVSTNNIFASGTITYNEDLTKRSIHLRPSQANAAAIQGWISATCNAAGQPTKSYWSTSLAPIYSNVVIPGPVATKRGGILLPDGRLVLSPSGSSNIGIFNPVDLSLSLIDFPASSGTSQMYGVGVLAPNGSVVFPPFNSSNAGVFNPISYGWSNISGVRLSSGLFSTSVLGPNGNVICVPSFSDNICEVNVNSNPPTLANICQAGGGVVSSKYSGGVLLPNGNVVLIPSALANIGMYSPLSSPPVCSNINLGYAGNFQGGVLAPNGNVIMIPNSVAGRNTAVFNPTLLTVSNINFTGPSYAGGCLTPSGNIILCPNALGSNIGLIDPVALTFSNIVGSGSIAVRGATLLPDGRVFFGQGTTGNIVVLDTMTPAPPEFCLSPYVNKF